MRLSDKKMNVKQLHNFCSFSTEIIFSVEKIESKKLIGCIVETGKKSARIICIGWMHKCRQWDDYAFRMMLNDGAHNVKWNFSRGRHLKMKKGFDYRIGILNLIWPPQNGHTHTQTQIYTSHIRVHNSRHHNEMITDSITRLGLQNRQISSWKSDLCEFIGAWKNIVLHSWPQSKSEILAIFNKSSETE